MLQDNWFLPKDYVNHVGKSASKCMDKIILQISKIQAVSSDVVVLH
jgi:hypothetical protein